MKSPKPFVSVRQLYNHVEMNTLDICWNLGTNIWQMEALPCSVDVFWQGWCELTGWIKQLLKAKYLKIYEEEINAKFKITKAYTFKTNMHWLCHYKIVRCFQHLTQLRSLWSPHNDPKTKNKTKKKNRHHHSKNSQFRGLNLEV